MRNEAYCNGEKKSIERFPRIHTFAASTLIRESGFQNVVCMYVCTYACMYVMYVCTYVYVRMYVCEHR
jgi:hypothetical protein